MSRCLRQVAAFFCACYGKKKPSHAVEEAAAMGRNLRSKVLNVHSKVLNGHSKVWNVRSEVLNGKFIGLLGLFLRMVEANASHRESNLIGLISGSCLDVSKGLSARRIFLV